ncbi:Uu.00g092840.m01.CDS01 [Anthostomella pinea]|uniref:Uu.00g092840.m01.CDS01 n=1 Tax=Anthostomella pinea TaxID=933095 RepID=A0AAI8VNF6_9PEZI|nr:Uu.00g092840.m01.CDS01 [Anthostomella pinea]
MRPQVLASALLSAARAQSISACPTTRTTTAAALRTTFATCPITTSRLFSTSPPHSSLVRPQAETTTSKQEIPIPTPSAPATMSTPISANSVLELIKARRSYYQLTKDLPIPASRVDEIVKEALLHVPSSFNSQSNRIVVLYGADHDKLWDITSEILKPYVTDEAAWASTEKRMAGFRGGAGTVLFFDDQETVFEYQKNVPLYKDKFPAWATQSDAMLQFACWTALEAEGLGANLQHYNPLIDERVAKEWGVPTTWQLNAQLVFGGRAGEPGPKTFKPVEERFKSFGA